MASPMRLSRPKLSDEQIQDLRLAASQMSGAKRRAFQAEMTLKYCVGSARLAKTGLGWSPEAVRVGLAEKRTGLICDGAQPAYRGRPRWEEQHPEVARRLVEIAEAQAQQDPTFATTLTYTRLTAAAALEALRDRGVSEDQLPSPSTMAEVLNRLGYRLRKGVKAKPLKKIKETDAIFDNIKKKGSIWIPVSYARRSPKRGWRSPLPRIRALCTNSKQPRYRGSFSWEIPRWGRSQERSSDQKPSMVLTWIS